MGELLLRTCVLFQPNNRCGGQGRREVSYHPGAGRGELGRRIKLVLKGGMFRCRWVA